jgi:hypothetical protein
MPPRHAYWTILIDGQPTAFRSAEREELQPTFNRLKQKHPDTVMKWFERGRVWESRDEARQALDHGYKVWSGGKLVPPRRPRGVGGREGDASSDAPGETRDRGWRPGGQHRDPREKYAIAKKAKWQRFKDKIRDRRDRREPEPPTRRGGASAPPGDGAPARRSGVGSAPPRNQRFPKDRPQEGRPRDERAKDWRREEAAGRNREREGRFDKPRGPEPRFSNRGPDRRDQQSDRRPRSDNRDGRGAKPANDRRDDHRASGGVRGKPHGAGRPPRGPRGPRKPPKPRGGR